MLEIPFDPLFPVNMDRTQSLDALPCVICGRACRKPRYKVYVNSGFSHILTRDEFKHDTGQMGMFPIGADCLQRHAEIQPYVQITFAS